MIIEITSCNDCPFCNNDNEYGSSCNLPGNNVEDFEMCGYNQSFIPDKCQLNNQTIVVSK